MSLPTSAYAKAAAARHLTLAVRALRSAKCSLSDTRSYFPASAEDSRLAQIGFDLKVYEDELLKLAAKVEQRAEQLPLQQVAT